MKDDLRIVWFRKWRMLGLIVFLLGVMSLSVFAAPDDCRIEITSPSDANGPVTPGHGFFITGTIAGKVPLPVDAVLRISVLDEQGREQRFAECSQKDRDVIHRFCDAFFYYAEDVDPQRKSLRAKEFPCLVVANAEDPDASLRNANIKCWYSDTAFNSFIPYATDESRGLIMDDGIGYTDANGNPYDGLPIGNYTAVAVLKDSQGRTIASAQKPFAIAPAERSILCRFRPEEHFRTMMEFAAKNKISMNLDYLPGYYKDPNGNDRGGLRAMFIGGDSALYKDSHVTFVEYIAGANSSSLVFELPYLEKYYNIDDPERFTVYHYDIGEPSLRVGGKTLKGKLVRAENGDKLHLCRADLAINPTEGKLDFKNAEIRDTDTDLSDGVNLSDTGSSQLAISGLVFPHQLKDEEVLFNPAENKTGLLNRVENIVYTVKSGSKTASYQKPVVLIRKFDDGAVYDSVMEFYHVFARDEIDPSGNCEVTLYGIDKNGKRVKGTEESFVVNRAPAGSVSGKVTPKGINKFGNVSLGIRQEDFRKAGFAEGDIVAVHIGGKEIDMPFCTDYQDVKRGAPLLVSDQGVISLWVSMGSFAEAYHLAQREQKSDTVVDWKLSSGNSEDTVTLQMKQKAGYLEAYRLRREMAAMKPDPERHPNQTEEEFANFREIATTGMKRDTLYRSSSPLDNRAGRRKAADHVMKKHGIDHIINLYNTKEDAEAFEGYRDTYASTVDTAYIKMGLDYTSDRFQRNVADVVNYIAKNRGKYAVHCILGEHRTGAVCLILSALMGASYDEIVKDYMLTPYNLYGVKPGTKQYDLLVEDNVDAIIKSLFHVQDPKSADLPKLAREYVLSSGITEAVLAEAKANLGN